MKSDTSFSLFLCSFFKSFAMQRTLGTLSKQLSTLDALVGDTTTRYVVALWIGILAVFAASFFGHAELFSDTGTRCTNN